jgi:hypothetical protein
MKKRTIAFCCVMLLTSLWTTGCWSRRELNELSIVVAMGIDQEWLFANRPISQCPGKCS